MAALPVGTFPAPRRPALRLVVGGDELVPQERPSAPSSGRAPTPAAGTRAPARPSRGLRPAGAGRRRFLPGLLTLGLLGGLWWGAGALSSLRSSGAAGHVPGATLVAGESYVVHSGDTLWSIATRLDPTGDPRPIVDQLGAELGGDTLQPGEVLHLP